MIKYLLGKATTGKFRFAVVECDEEWHDDVKGYTIQRSYGQVQGKTTLSPLIVVDRTKQKRNWQEQYTLQFNSEVKKFLDKGYKEVEKHPNEYTDEELHELYGSVTTNQYGIIKPMLAKQSEKVTNTKIFDKNWLGSRKINGTRCLMYWDGENVQTASRGGEHYNAATSHLREHPVLRGIFQCNPTLILDGELYKHGKSLQQISGAARMEKNAYDCDWLEYWIYDCIHLDELDTKAADRLAWLKSLADTYGFGFDPYKEWEEGDLQVQFVPQVEISGWDNMKKLHDEYVSEGFEGLVIRDPSKPYKPNGRTNDMIKIKQYIDETFKVVGYELGLRGSEDMCFICEMEDGRTFKAMPLGDRSVKAEYIDNFEEKYKGHLGDCKYFELSDEGIPCQPKFLAFRFDLE